MKEINFVHTISPKQYKETHKWINVTIILFLTTIVILSLWTFHQLGKLKILRKSIILQKRMINTLNKILEERKHLDLQNKRLGKQSKFINRYKTNPKQGLDLILNINKMLSPRISLESLYVAKTDLEITFTCPSEQFAYWFIQKLYELSQIKLLQTTSIYPKNQQFLFTIKGQLE